MVWTNVNLPTWACFHISCSFSGWSVSGKKIFKDLCSIYSYEKIRPPPHWGHPTLGIMIFINLNLSLTEDASTQVTAVLADRFQRRIFSKSYSIYSYVKHLASHCGPTYPWGLWFDQTWIYTAWECFHISFSFSGHMDFWEEDFWQIPTMSFNCLHFQEAMALLFMKLESPLLKGAYSKVKSD